MDLADDVSYSVHDVEDAIVLGRVDPGALWTDAVHEKVVTQVRDWYDPDVSDDALAEALDRLLRLPFWVQDHDGGRPALAALKDMTSQLIGRFCDAAGQATRARVRERTAGPVRRLGRGAERCRGRDRGAQGHRGGVRDGAA